ncbi:class I SAM-dependent methyltransferase [Fimbriimonas ginsengisoli]|uniref:Methyltransferase type 11 n=1 Tax=Fimbriimonas ginsengisoli Gsoil 348 TaxID=661478 RepID=A0A068NRJ0_FIMGI|nr:class I SAM-dependent methyltransferase [Fimbriimonas ginsengisoli]AIE86143.1 Methyltransferase type 11 [Fimbriimonas ginsengisoli Gsoil 348]
MGLAPTERFSSRVENYVKYRPHYPDAVLDLLRIECGLSPASVVADIGSGTGISTELLLQSGAVVYAIEPNREMREAAEAMLGDRANFRSMEGTAEATGLPVRSVDLIVAGQAFHWFDHARARQEFQRIVRPDGWVALMWNERISGGSEFLDGYEKILQEYAPEYLEVRHKEFDTAKLAPFFRGSDVRVATYPNGQAFDLDGLKGRVLSSSYAPEAGQPEHEPMMRALEALFARTARDGKVDFLYETQVYFGRI